MLRVYGIGALFFAIPAVALVLLVVSVALYLSAQRKNRRSPGAVSEQTIKRREVFLILSAAAASLLLLAVAVCVGLLFFSVAYM